MMHENNTVIRLLAYVEPTGSKDVGDRFAEPLSAEISTLLPLVQALKTLPQHSVKDEKLPIDLFANSLGLTELATPTIPLTQIYERKAQICPEPPPYQEGSSALATVLTDIRNAWQYDPGELTPEQLYDLGTYSDLIVNGTIDVPQDIRAKIAETLAQINRHTDILGSRTRLARYALFTLAVTDAALIPPLTINAVQNLMSKLT